jgi:hypothetical protein
VKLGLCCCGSGGTVPQQNCGGIVDASPFRAKSFRIVFPQIYPLSKGRVVVPTDISNDKGKCASTANHIGWSMPTCAYYNELYLYDTLHDQCNNEASDFCWESYGPSNLSLSQSTWNFTGEQLYQVQGTFGYITKTFSDFTTKSVQFKFYRCYELNNSFFYNRSVLLMDASFKYTVSRRICVNGSFRDRSANCYFTAKYVGDPYPLDVGISETLYLKAFSFYEPAYCGGPDGEDFRTYVNGIPSDFGLGSEGSFLQTGSYPGSLPNTVSVLTL